MDLKLDHYLILLDDFIVENSFDKKRSISDTLFSAGRHFCVSCIITSQQYTLIPSSHGMILFIKFQIKQKKIMIYEQCSSMNMTEDEFEKNI